MNQRQDTQRASWEGELFRLLAENVEDFGIFIIDTDRNVLHWSRGAQRLLGYSEEEILGKTADVIFTPEDTERGVPAQEIQTAIDAGRAADDRWHVRKDGTRFWCSGSVTSLWDESGDLRGLVKIMRDVTGRKQADEARFRLAAIVESSEDAIIATDLDMTITSWNTGAQRLYGYSAEEAKGKSISILVPADRSHEVPAVVERIKRGETADPYETQRLHKDGHRIEIGARMSAIHDASGKMIGISIIARDITERKRLDRRRTARLVVTQILSEGASLAEVAPKILAAICKSLGWDVGAFWLVDREVGRLRCLDVWHAPSVTIERFEQTTRERLFERGVGLPGRIWASGKPAWIPDVVKDNNFPRAAIARDEGLHAAFGCPVLSEGAVQGIIEFFSHEIREPDVDFLEMMSTIGSYVGLYMERRRSQEDQAQSESRKSAILETALDCIITIDSEDRIVEFNPAAERTFGYRLADILGQRMGELIVPPSLRAKHYQGMAHYLATGEGPVLNRRIEITAMRSDGTEFPVELAVTRIPTPGRPMFTAYVRDITETKHTREQLKRHAAALLDADRRKDEFLAMLAHELRNPLAPLRSGLELMKLHGSLDSELEWTRDVMERQTQQMTRLVDDLLDVSRITRGKIELRTEAVDLATIVQRAVEAIRPLIEERRHSLTLSFPPYPLRLEADPARLQQVIANLLNNAAKYTNPGGQVFVDCLRDADEVVIRVRDTGIGIAPEMLPRVFDLFVQASSQQDRAHGGLGIGLTLVRRLVELHGGTLEAVSPGLGQGSTFIAHLPALPGHAENSTGAASVEQLHKESARRRILVVDDNVDAADSLARLLRLSGHCVEVANEGATALEKASADPPDVILLDLGMPGMNGYEVARKLRAQPHGKNVVLIALTGWGQQEDRRRSRAAGFDHHVVKPLDPSTLHDLVCQTRQAER